MFHLWVILELSVLVLEGERVVDLELPSILEYARDGVLAEVPSKGVRNVGEHEGNVVGQCTGEDLGQGGERVVHPESNAWNGTIDEDENGSDRGDLFSDLICDLLLVELVLLDIAGLAEPRCVEDTNLGKRLHLPTRFEAL